MMNQEDFDRLMLRRALLEASHSRDESTKVGCILYHPRRGIICRGVNSLPPGALAGRLDYTHRPEKYLWWEHSERQALYSAARQGILTEGATLYLASTPTKFPPCADCARALVFAGIQRLVTEPLEGDYERWGASCEVGSTILKEAGVEVATVAHRCDHPYQAWHAGVDQFLDSEKSVMLPCAVIGCPGGLDQSSVFIEEWPPSPMLFTPSSKPKPRRFQFVRVGEPVPHWVRLPDRA